MNTNWFGAVGPAILLIGSVIAIFYTGYMYWFKPEKYTDRLVKGFKDWMPFADYFRSYYKSPQNLWVMRVVTLFFMAFFIFIFIRMILSFTGVLP